jgi:CRISPR/Cas system-associated endonuclease Cas1
LKWKGEAPEGWEGFARRARSWKTGRLGEAGAQFSNRFALTPCNAILNYCGGIVAAQCTRAITGLGLDPAFGMLHSARPGMAALTWDVMELLRHKIEVEAFLYMRARMFEACEFKIVKEPEPHVRFGREIAKELAERMIRRVPFEDIVKAVRKVATFF